MKRFDPWFQLLPSGTLVVADEFFIAEDAEGGRIKTMNGDARYMVSFRPFNPTWDELGYFGRMMIMSEAIDALRKKLEE